GPAGLAARAAIYAHYKANRDAQPEDLSRQMPLVRELVDAYRVPVLEGAGCGADDGIAPLAPRVRGLVDAYRVPVLEVAGCEADDVIATLATRAPAGTHVTILSTDKDLMQLVGERIVLLDTMKDRRYGPTEVEQRFGVPPERVLDLRALVGDPSDNIPGVKGIGEKGPAKLIAEYGTIEQLLERADEITAAAARH